MDPRRGNGCSRRRSLHGASSRTGGATFDLPATRRAPGVPTARESTYAASTDLPVVDERRKKIEDGGNEGRRSESRRAAISPGERGKTAWRSSEGAIAFTRTDGLARRGNACLAPGSAELILKPGGQRGLAAARDVTWQARVDAEPPVARYQLRLPSGALPRAAPVRTALAAVSRQNSRFLSPSLTG